ncbi:MAG: hypothetical protein ACK4K1_07975 [Flavobacterium sp.]
MFKNQTFWITVIGVILGAMAGYAYYYYIGCATSSCSITSSPVNSTLYGSLMGGLLFSMWKKETPKKNS